MTAGPSSAPFYLSLLLCLSVPATLAQEQIALDTETITRLGIEFSPVDSANAERGDRYPARVMNSPEAQQQVIARYPGQLLQWHVRPDDRVVAGQALATLESSAVLDLQESWLQAVQQREQAAINLARDQDLHDLGVIAQQRLDNTRRQWQQAVLLANAARERLQQAGHDETAFTALSEGKSLGQYVLRAPRAARVARRDFKSGEMVAAQSTVIQLRDDLLWLEAQLPASLATGLAAGDRLTLSEPSLQDTVSLTLMTLDAYIDPDSQTRTLWARFDDSAELLPGQIVNLRLPVPATGILVPASSVVRHEGQALVYVRTSQGVQIRPLSLRPLGSDYLALDGLAPGDIIVSRGAALLKGMQLGLGAD